MKKAIFLYGVYASGPCPVGYAPAISFSWRTLPDNRGRKGKVSRLRQLHM